MSDCCSSQSSTPDTDSCCASTSPRKRACPVDGTPSSEVKTSTMLHHLKNAWSQPLQEQKYYFCDNPGCDVVYFGEDDSRFYLHDVRDQVGQKQSAPDKLLCYCFGVRQSDYLHNPEIKAFVVAQTKASTCACDSRNPSGRCCLKDFPKLPKN